MKRLIKGLFLFHIYCLYYIKFLDLKLLKSVDDVKNDITGNGIDPQTLKK